MINDAIDDRITKQKDICKDMYVSKSDFFKDKYTQVITVLGTGVLIIVAVVTFSMKISNDIAVLKSEVSELNAKLEAKGRISYKLPGKL